MSRQRSGLVNLASYCYSPLEHKGVFPFALYSGSGLVLYPLNAPSAAHMLWFNIEFLFSKKLLRVVTVGVASKYD